MHYFPVIWNTISDILLYGTVYLSEVGYKWFQNYLIYDALFPVLENLVSSTSTPMSNWRLLLHAN